MSEHGHCPACKVDLDGGDIVETFVAQGYTPEKARKIASNYGYGPGRTQWGREIAISCMERDCIVAIKCPDCGHEWGRS